VSSSAITGPLLSDVSRSADGSAAAPSWSFQNSPTMGFYRVSANVLGLSTAGVQRMVVDASGNVGIGTASPADKLEVSNGTTDASNGLAIRSGRYLNAGQEGPQVRFYSDNQTSWTGTREVARIGVLATSADHRTGSIAFYTKGASGDVAPTERMRIDASGNLGLGVSSLITGSTNGIWLGLTSGTRRFGASTTGSFNQIEFWTTGFAGAINTSGTSTTYTSASDYRLKENVQPIVHALEKVAALKPVTYKWKVDGSEGEGFIAHELAEVCPAAVVGEKDAVNEDGSISAQGIDPAKLVGLLTAAIQELSAKNDALEARLAALEAK
jgi:hypothetical protein